MEFEIFGIPYLKEGNSIHIKKENRGKFTKSAKAAGQSVQEHARLILNNSRATPLLKKRANFARNASEWKHKRNELISKCSTGSLLLTEELKAAKMEEDRISDKKRKLEYLINNKDQLNLLLLGLPHKRSLVNILLNEGYTTNMLNLKYTINPDSLVVTNNPDKYPGNQAYSKLGNFGLDIITDKEAELANISKKRLKNRKAFDNGLVLLTTATITPREAMIVANNKLNVVKKWLYTKYGPEEVSKFFKEHPGSEDEILYAGYKMPYKLKRRINIYPTVESFYQTYLNGGLNVAFKQVRNYLDVISKIFKK